MNLSFYSFVELSLKFSHRGGPHSCESELFLSFVGYGSALASKNWVNVNVILLAA